MSFRVSRNGPAYLRSGNGDYELSDNEIQPLINQRGQPVHERSPVKGADLDRDLDADLVQQYLSEEVRNNPRLRALAREQ